LNGGGDSHLKSASPQNRWQCSSNGWLVIHEQDIFLVAWFHRISLKVIGCSNSIIAAAGGKFSLRKPRLFLTVKNDSREKVSSIINMIGAYWVLCPMRWFFLFVTTFGAD
jgi:hypothetical protein